MTIGISGKIGSGKDTVGKIIQYLIFKEKYKNDTFPYTCNDGVDRVVNQLTLDNFICHQTNKLVLETFQIKKFADTLKDIVCLLIGCTREQLEDPVFKNTELGEEWNKWYVAHELHTNTPMSGYFDSELKALEDKQQNSLYTKYGIARLSLDTHKVIMTPRLLLQLLGTQCGRNIIHPNIWVNSLFSKYNSYSARGSDYEFEESKWIITDVRFPNELQAIKDRQGISIRVNRSTNIKVKGENYWLDYDEWKFQTTGKKPHESETALDNATFDYTIDNNGTIEELVEKVKEILIKEKVLCQ